VRNIELLKQNKAAKVKEARGLTELAEKENRNLTQEEKKSIDTLLGEIREMEQDIEREERMQALEMAKNPVTPVIEDRTKEKRTAFFKLLRHGASALNPEERALVSDTTGAYFFPEDLETEIYRTVGSITVMRGLCSTRTTVRDKVRRRHITEVSVGWGKLELGTEITEGTPTPSQDTIYVEDLYGLTKIGEDELMDTDANLEAIVIDSFARAIAEAEDKAFVVGRGHTTYSEPEGVTLDANITATDLAAADTMAVEDLMGAVYRLKPQYRRNGVWVMNSATELAIRKLRTSYDGTNFNGEFLWQPSIQAGRPNSLLGYPIYNQDDITSLAASVAANTDAIIAAFGDFKAGYQIVDRMGLRITRLNELYAESGLVGFKAHFRVGGAPVRTEAFQLIKNNT
jgi:HK97 family phage major capsid protein